MEIFNININYHFRDKLGLWLSTNWLAKRLFGENRSIIFNRSICRSIIKYYGGDKGHLLNVNTGNLGYGFIHYAFILNHKPRRILCVGSRKGYIPSICALACQENKKGHVDFVDAGYDEKDKNNWSGIGWWRKTKSDYHFGFLNANKYLRAYIMTTKEFAKKWHFNYDYIYIDGDHSYEGVKTDYKLFWKRLNKGGFMIFHDVNVKSQRGLPKFGVWKLWEEIKSNKLTFLNPKHSGLGIIQKI
jgi:hypothetical protein